MANIVREALNADGMGLPIFCGGMTRVGISISGTWVGTISFFASNDGIRFYSVSVTPFASGTAVTTSTANGSWWIDVANYVAVKVVFTRTSGTAIAVLAASVDASYQDAFLAASSKFISQSVAAGAANAITIAAQANRAWRVRTVVVGCDVAPAAAVLLTIADGATVLWATYVKPLLNDGTATVGGTFVVPLPDDPRTPGLTGGGIVNTPGNSMVITLAAPGGSVISKLNVEAVAA